VAALGAEVPAGVVLVAAGATAPAVHVVFAVANFALATLVAVKTLLFVE